MAKLGVQPLPIGAMRSMGARLVLHLLTASRRQPRRPLHLCLILVLFNRYSAIFKIWFTDKNEDGETELKRLTNLGLSKRLSPYNAYKQGKLVDLPFVGSAYLNLNDVD
ncbi:MAG: hypothetical protein NC453_22650 [Muribaculum sp.]|nr:hypothetical protein [Muribaculum sp.]